MFNLYQCGYGPIQSWVHRFGRRSWAQSLAHRKATLQRFQVGSVAAAHKHWRLQDNSPGHRDSRWRTANRPHLHLAQPKPRCPLQSTHSGRRRGRPEAKHVVHVLRQGRVPSASLKSERIHQHLSKIKASTLKCCGSIQSVEAKWWNWNCGISPKQFMRLCPSSIQLLISVAVLFNKTSAWTSGIGFWVRRTSNSTSVQFTGSTLPRQWWTWATRDVKETPKKCGSNMKLIKFKLKKAIKSNHHAFLLVFGAAFIKVVRLLSFNSIRGFTWHPLHHWWPLVIPGTSGTSTPWPTKVVLKW